MKNVLIMIAIVATGAIIFSSCYKTDSPSTCTAQDPALETDSILRYNTAHGYVGTKLDNGMYYQIVTKGTGAAPKVTNMVRVNYVGRFMDTSHVAFDSVNSSSGADLALSQVIQGWQVGVPLIQAGGVIRLMIPSKYAYGCTGSGGVSANRPLFFEISLLAVH